MPRLEPRRRSFRDPGIMRAARRGGVYSTHYEVSSSVHREEENTVGEPRITGNLCTLKVARRRESTARAARLFEPRFESPPPLPNV